VYIPRGKFIAYRKDKITPSSSSKDTGNHASLGANQEQAYKAQAFTYDAGLSKGVSSQWDSFTHKYEA
jgi:hypothetical protein